jgi:hypothetical protein
VFRGAMCRLQKQRKKPAEEDCVFRREKGKRKDCVSTKKYTYTCRLAVPYIEFHIFFCQRLRSKSSFSSFSTFYYYYLFGIDYVIAIV